MKKVFLALFMSATLFSAIFAARDLQKHELPKGFFKTVEGLKHSATMVHVEDAEGNYGNFPQVSNPNGAGGYSTRLLDTLLYVARYQNSWGIFRNGQLLATTTMPLGQLVQDLGASVNVSPMFFGDSIVFLGHRIALPRPTSQLVVSVSDSTAQALGLNADSLFMIWGDTMTHWDVSPFATGGTFTVVSADHWVSNDDKMSFVSLVRQPSLGLWWFKQGLDDTTQDVSGFQQMPDSAVGVYILKGNVPYFMDTLARTITIGSITIPMVSDPTFDQHTYCAQGYCVRADIQQVFPISSTDYITQAYRLGIASSNNWYVQNFMETRFAAEPTVYYSMTVSYDIAELINSYWRQDQCLVFKKLEDAIQLGPEKIRGILRHIGVPGFQHINVPFHSDLGLHRFENGKFYALIGRDGQDNNILCVYDQYHNYIRSYRAGDTHDAMVLEGSSFSAYLGHATIGSINLQPPVIVNNLTGVEYSPAIPQEFMPLYGDSCAIAQVGPIFGPGDWQHGNSVWMVYIPGYGLLVFESSRNLDNNLSYPLAAWRMEDTSTGVMVMDRNLMQQLHDSPFGFGRDGGHNFVGWMILMSSDRTSFVISQYDNRICDDPNEGPSYGHTTVLTYNASADSFSVTDTRTFVGAPSVAKGNVALFKNGADTIVGIYATNPIFTIDDMYSRRAPLVLCNYSTGDQIGSMNPGMVVNSAGESVPLGSYQANLTEDTFVKPGFTVSVVDLGDTLKLEAHGYPITGEWFWLMENIPLSRPFFVAKAKLAGTGGCAFYMSGWYSQGDTIPGVSSLPGCPRSRWCSDPVWVADHVITGTELLQNQMQQVQLFPSPTSDDVFIGSVDKEKVQSVTVTNLVGQVVFRSQEHILTIPMRNLPTGTYLITIIIADKVEQIDRIIVTKKVIKIQ